LFSFENMFHDFELHLDVGDLFQVAEVSLEKGSEFFEHKQLCDEITYAVSGEARIYSDNDCELLSAGQIHYIRKGVSHRIVVEPENNFRYVCVGFLPNTENADVAAFIRSSGEKNHFVISDNGYVKRLSELMVREFYNCDEQTADMVDRFIAQILIVMTRILNNKSESFYSRESKKSASHALYKVLRYMDSEYLQIESISQIAESLSYSEYYLSHLFREKMGITMKEYLNRKKIAHAIELLEQCDLTIEQISDHLKFASPRVFRRVFKQYAGCAPSQYRKQ